MCIRDRAILKVRTGTLNQLYKLKPLTRSEIEQAAGYGVFEINGLNAVLAGKHGRGVVHEKSGKVTYMQLALSLIHISAPATPRAPPSAAVPSRSEGGSAGIWARSAERLKPSANR